MRILLVADRSLDDRALEEALRAVGADVARGPDVEAAVAAARDGRADAVLVTSSELRRLSRGEEQISSWLRHQVMNSLATVVGYAQILGMGLGGDSKSDRARLQAIAEHALRIRDAIQAADGVRE
jgi:ABC-type amino acid transport substrate-binding protein